MPTTWERGAQKNGWLCCCCCCYRLCAAAIKTKSIECGDVVYIIVLLCTHGESFWPSVHTWIHWYISYMLSSARGLPPHHAHCCASLCTQSACVRGVLSKLSNEQKKAVLRHHLPYTAVVYRWSSRMYTMLRNTFSNRGWMDGSGWMIRRDREFEPPKSRQIFRYAPYIFKVVCTTYELLWETKH